ncbi:hypothetical protein PPACK8108_LOCUS21447 [Phakopsora pachyrhizi]|uniref:SNF5-domain-containing protein n=1 Tax=Phakopsora pachyrhizi TaxID=170000 RepID=A0AAV0BHQ4_PHAPC|nr:hypothetical protein PPACK8108_LOCUS21447 [Phakopsora pachyrhizi]
MDGHPASPLRDLYHSAMGANPQFSTANGMQQVPYGRNQSVPGFSPSNTQFHQSNVAFLNPDSSTSSHPTPQNDTSTPAKITSNGVFQTVDAHPQVYQQGITSPNFSSQLPLANQPLGALPGPSQPIRNPSAGIFMQQPNPQASHSPSVDGSAQVLQLPRVSGMDPAAIMEIAMLIRQPNGPNRLSHAQMAMWNEYRAKCGASPSGIQPRPANHSASLLGSVQPQSHPAQPQTVPHSLPNLNYSSQNQQQAIQRQQKLSPQQHAQLQQMQQQMLIRQQQQRQQQQVQQLLQQQQHHQHQQQAHHNQQLQSFSQQQKQLQPKSQVHQQQSSQQQQQQKQKQLQEQQQNHLQQHKEEEEEMGGGEADTESKELVQRQQEQQQQPQSQQQQHQLQKQYSHEQQQNNHTQSLQLQSSSAAARFSPSLSSRAPSVSYSMPRSTTPSFTSQLPSLTNNNRKPLIGLESPSQKTIQSPSKPSQIFPHPYSSQQQVNGNQHHPIPLTRTQSPSTSTPLYPRRLPISPSFTKHYPDNSVLGPDGRPRSRKKLSLEEQRKLSRWIKHDEAFEIAFQRDRMQKRAIMQDVCRQQVMINRLDWLGEARNGRATGRCQIRLPLEREREGSTGKRKNRPRLKLNKSEIKLVSEVEEILVPIRLEIEIDHWKLRDTFTWNLKEPVVTPEQFAAHLCEDLILPAQHFIGPIVNSIREQLDEYRIHQNFEGHYARHSSSEARNPDSKYEADVRRAGGSDVIKMIIEDEGNGEATQGAEEKWWNGWKGRVFDLGCDSEAGTETDEAAQNPLKENDDELRIPIVLDIICGHVHLTDRFEWEISEVNNSPEDFVEVYVNDLGLAGEFKTAIAHSIREQIETYVKSLALVEHVNGYPVPNDELRYAFLQPITEPIRTSQVDDYTPFLNFLNAEELDRQEKEHDREARRKRRQTRSRRGITLPDRESQRTVRSIVPIQGMKMVMPYQDDNEDLIVPVQPVAEPYPIEESVFENVDPPEHIPKKNVPVNKEPPGSEPLFGTPSKVVGNRVSRRLRGATADGQSGTPPPTSRGGDSNQPEKDDAPTPSNSGTPAPNTTTKKNNKQQEVASQTNSAKKFSAGRPRGINWKALGLHDPMINGVWHCSNCGCPEHIAVGRRKGLGGKDTLCGEWRYMHRYKKNRPTVYNTSADYHTSLKLEADSAKQAIADQEMLRQEKNRLEHLATRGSENKKPKKEGKV